MKLWTGILFLHVALLHQPTASAKGQSDNDNEITTVDTIDETKTTTVQPEVITPKPEEHKSHKHRLRDKLLSGYDRMVHPVLDHNQATTVNIGMALIHISLDEMAGVTSVDAWMRLNWTDEHLTWEPSDFGNLTKLHFGVDEIWKPDILLYNSADETRFDPYGKTHFLVDFTGDVLWVPPAHLKALCKLDLRFWPMDTQECKLKFGSWTSHGGEIDLGLYRGMKKVEVLNYYSNNGEWQVKETSVETRRIKYNCCDEYYPDVTFTFTLERSSPCYKSTIVLPCMVIMLMTVCCFLLPPTAGEKVHINGFAFIASVLYLIYFAKSIPFLDDETPILVTFYSNTTALVGLGLLLNVTCLSMCKERKYSGPPKFFKLLFAGNFGKFLCLGHYYHQVSSTHQRLVLELTDMAESEQQAEGEDPDNSNGFRRQDSTGRMSPTSIEQSMIMKDWLLVAAGLDRIFFILYSIAFLVVLSVYI